MGIMSNWWEKQHGRQLGIAATAAGALGILLLVSLYQLLFLQNHVDWGDFHWACHWFRCVLNRGFIDRHARISYFEGTRQYFG